MKRGKKTYSIIMVAAILVLAICGFCHYQSERFKKCPDRWSDGNGLWNEEIFMKDGKKLALTDEEKEWIRNNCDLKPNYSY